MLRAGAFYAAAAWALAQGISQLSAPFGMPDWVTRWFVIACVIGFPFWLAFAWFYEFTPTRLKRESEIAPADSVTAHTGKKFDRWIIAVLALAAVLLVINQFVLHHDVPSVANAANAKTIAAELARVPQKSVAVLPLANESGNPKQQYFADGMSEELISDLTQINGLKVTGKYSSFKFRNTKDSPAQIGAALGVAHLIHGSVFQQGDRIRVTVSMIRAKDGSSVWSHSYDEPLKNVFAIQSKIGRAVAEALKVKLRVQPGSADQSERPPNGNLDAYNAYLRGNALSATGSDSNLRKSILYYDAAIRLDPGYADAYARKSGDWTVLAGDLGGHQAQDAYAKAQQAADTALSLDQNSVTGHLAQGELLYNRDFDWTGAVAEFRRTLQLAPNDGRVKLLLGTALASLGQTRQAIQLIHEALLTDPLNPLSYAHLAVYYSGQGRLDDAERATRTQMRLEPHDAGLYGVLMTIEIQRGNAKAAMQDALRVPDGPWRAISMAMALQNGGDKTAADAALKTLIDKYAAGGPYQIAEVYALHNDPANMFKWLDRAWTARDTGIRMLLNDPFILRYKDDPRFAAFCNKVGLPTTTDAKAMR